MKTSANDYLPDSIFHTGILKYYTCEHPMGGHENTFFDEKLAKEFCEEYSNGVLTVKEHEVDMCAYIDFLNNIWEIKDMAHRNTTKIFKDFQDVWLNMNNFDFEKSVFYRCKDGEEFDVKYSDIIYEVILSLVNHCEYDIKTPPQFV